MQLLDEAAGKYAAALQVNKSLVKVYYSLGDVSVELALLTQSEQRALLFRKAAEAYKEGVKFEGVSRVSAINHNSNGRDSRRGSDRGEMALERALKQANMVYQRALETRFACCRCCCYFLHHHILIIGVSVPQRL